MTPSAPRLRSTAVALLLVAAACGGTNDPSGPTSPSVTSAAPGAPAGVSATAGIRSATVSWAAPASSGGSPITAYTVGVSPATSSALAAVTGTTASVTGLADGTTYSFRVTATNAAGPGPASAPSAPVTTPSLPGAPTAVSATGGNQAASIAWTAPASDGGSPITAYTVGVSPASPSAFVAVIGTTASITGLANGTTYTFSVAATSAVGTGPASGASNAVTPVAPPGAPGAPTAVSATAGIRGANVSWTAPVSSGGSAITGYTLLVSPSAASSVVTITGTTASVTGLANGTSYTFAVTATNAAGTSPASTPSASVTTPDVPSAPTAVTATAGNQSASVAWTAPASNGGSAITGYVVTPSPAAPSAGFAIAGTSASVTGLTNGTSYAFVVAATNAVGTGPASTSSNAVVPTAPPPALTSVTPGSGTSAGGTAVTLTGTGFVAGTGGSTVTFGGVAAAVASRTTTSIVVTTPAHGAGPQPVTVQNPDGRASTMAAGFNFVDPPPATAPVISSVTPASGPGVGGTAVSITGLGFGTPVTVTFGGAAATVSNQTATSIDVIAPAHGLGLVDVVVANPDAQAATRTSAFTYVFPADPPPSLSSMAPAQGPSTGGTTVTLAGSGFVAPVTVTFGAASATVVSVTATAVTVVTPPLPAGTVAVVVANADTQTAAMPAAFTYTSAPVVPPPSLGGVTPASGPTAGNTTVALSGADFDAGASVAIGGQPAPVVSRTATTLTVTTGAHGAGAVDVVVTNGSGKSATLVGGFTYVAPPTISSVAPSSGPTSGGTSVTIAGTGFVPGAGGSSVTIGGAAATVTSSTTLTLVVTAPAHPAGAQPVTVQNPDGQTATLAAAFSFVDPPPAPTNPTITGLSPTSGPTAGGTSVTLTGANFVNGGIVTFGGVAGTIVGQVLSNSLTVATPFDQPAGAVDVTFLNPFTGGVASIQSGFTYVAPPPTIDGLSIRGAPPAGGTTLNVTGTGLQPGVTATFGGAPATGLVLSDSTPPRKLLTLTVPAQPAGAGEFVDLIVRNPDGQTATFAGFHYGPPPVITSVSAAAPSTLATVHKGDVITITGTDFSVATGVQVQIGQLAVINSATATQLVVVAPKNNPGTYQVVVTNHDGQFGVGPSGFNVVYPGP